MRPYSISERIRRRRLALGLSMSEIARRMDTSVATVSRYENGWQRFEIYTLRKLASALGCRLRVSMVPEKPQTAVSEPTGLRRLKRLFWDRPLRKSDLKRYPLWVVERVIEYGQMSDIHFLMRYMERRTFLEYVSRARFASRRTEKFWKKMLAKEGIPCTRKFSRNTAWNSSTALKK
ncbi:MAG: helix-turn-helix transcriptional regulator [Kiritimatiellia bacterium]